MAAEPQPEDIPLTVLYEDAQLLVIDKPAGLVVHPGAGARGGHPRQRAAAARRPICRGSAACCGPASCTASTAARPACCVVAKDDETHRALVRQFAGRTVEKEYLALVHGVPARDAGSIDAPIGRDPVHRKRMSVRAPRGREARTSWSVVERFDGAALLRVRIHTGRTHQIRVHLASIGHPVAGDATYGGTRTPSSRSREARAALAALTAGPARRADQLHAPPRRAPHVQRQSSPPTSPVWPPATAATAGASTQAGRVARGSVLG